MTAETGSNEQQTPVFLNDDLAKEISPGGRLDQMLSLGKDLDVTWVIDPDLLASVDAMTRSYKIQAGDNRSTGTHQAAAKRGSAELQTESGQGGRGPPFRRPDLASLAHNGTSRQRLAEPPTKTPPTSPLSTVQPILHVKPTTDFAWPVNGAVDPSIIKVATSAGADKVIARSDSLRDGGLPYTPSAARPIGGGTTAVVADARPRAAFEGDLTKAGAATLAVQQFLAQSLTLQADEETTQHCRRPAADAHDAPGPGDGRGAHGTCRAGPSAGPRLGRQGQARPRCHDKGAVDPAYPSSLRKQELPIGPSMRSRPPRTSSTTSG